MNKILPDWQLHGYANECPDLKQGIGYCPWCNKTEHVGGFEILRYGMPYCCNKKMNLLPYYDLDALPGKRKDSYDLNIIALSRS